MRPGKILPLLMRISVDCVVDQIGANAAVVQERVALAGSAVADDLFAFSAQPDQSSSSSHFVSATRPAKPVPLEVGVSAARSRSSSSRRPAPPCGHRRLAAERRRAASRRGTAAPRRRRSRGRAWEEARRASSGRSTSSARGRSCRTAAPRSVGRDAAPRSWPRRAARARSRCPATKSFSPGTCASTLFATTRSAGGPPRRAWWRASSRRSRRSSRRLWQRRVGDVRSGSMPSAGSPVDEMLEQVAVVRGKLDDEALGRQPEALGDPLRVPPRVRNPGLRIRREVRVVAEDLGRRTYASSWASRHSPHIRTWSG